MNLGKVDIVYVNPNGKCTVAIESDVKGFYRIPESTLYVVSKMGDLLNLRTLSLCRPYRSYNGYMTIVYHNQEGERIQTSRHRLIARIFISKPDHLSDIPDDELVVNHKNLIPGDDRLGNLEWCTHSENTRHAFDNGVSTLKLSVEARDVVTKVVTKYQSLSECARENGVSREMMKWRLSFGTGRVFPEGKQYRYSEDHNPMPWTEDPITEFGRKQPIQVQDFVLGEVLQFDSQREAAKHLKVSEASISVWLNLPNQPVVEGIAQLKQDDAPWREVSDPILDYEDFSKRCAVVTIDDKTDRATIYAYGNLCAGINDIMPTCLSYRLRSRGASVFSDGLRYLYYKDFIKSKWSAIERNPIVRFP